MTPRVLVRAIALVLPLALALVLCASAAGAESAPASAQPLRVLAAASLTEVVEGLAQDFVAGTAGTAGTEGARGPSGAGTAPRVATGFGASSDLARQIRDGAPADVFVSASPEWIDFLREAGMLAGEPVLVARNALVCVAPRGSRLKAGAAGGAGAAAAVAAVADLRSLLARIEADDLVAIADAGVPAGDYARRALVKLGLEAAFESRLVGQKDVRAVLHAVEQGEVVAGFVYATDARVARVATLFAFDPATHPKIEYFAVVLRSAADADRAGSAERVGGRARPVDAERRGAADLAQRFVAYLGSPVARARLSAAGFVLP